MGSVEGCFLNPIPGSTTPMLVRALGVIVRRSVLFGKCYTCFIYLCVCVTTRGGGGNDLALGKGRQQYKIPRSI